MASPVILVLHEYISQLAWKCKHFDKVCFIPILCSFAQLALIVLFAITVVSTHSAAHVLVCLLEFSRQVAHLLHRIFSVLCRIISCLLPVPQFILAF